MQVMDRSFRKKLQALPDVVPRWEDGVNISLLDQLSLEDFILMLKSRLDSNPIANLNVINSVSVHLKGMRALLVILSTLNSGDDPGPNIISRIQDIAHLVVPSENFFVLQPDKTGKKYIITYSSREDAAVGMDIPIPPKTENISSDWPDETKTQFMHDLDDMLAAAFGTTRNMTVLPITLSEIHIGYLVATNKSGSSNLTPSANLCQSQFNEGDNVMLSFVAMTLASAIRLKRDSQSDERGRGGWGSGSSINDILVFGLDGILLTYTAGPFLSQVTGLSSKAEEFIGRHYTVLLSEFSNHISVDIDSVIKFGTRKAGTCCLSGRNKLINDVGYGSVTCDYDILMLGEGVTVSIPSKAQSVRAPENQAEFFVDSDTSSKSEGRRRTRADSKSMIALVFSNLQHFGAPSQPSNNRSNSIAESYETFPSDLLSIAINDLQMLRHHSMLSKDIAGTIDEMTMSLTALMEQMSKDEMSKSSRAASPIPPGSARHVSLPTASLARSLDSLAIVAAPAMIENTSPEWDLSNLSVPDDLFDLDFCSLDVSSKDDLTRCIYKLLDDAVDLDSIKINKGDLMRYLRVVSAYYHDRPFHNYHHATCVTHLAYTLVKMTNSHRYLDTWRLFAIVFSAVVHDVDHPGHTNMFEINSRSELALLYNDHSVLESHHCSTAFRLMQQPGCNFLVGCSQAEQNEFRKLVISCILATDMTAHFQLTDDLKKYASKRTAEDQELLFEDPADKLFLCKMLVHAADVSNPVRRFDIYKRWADRIADEFNKQVAREQELNLPILTFMISTDEKSACKNEVGFVSFVVGPMWRSLAVAIPALAPLVAQMEINLEELKRRSSDGVP